MFGEGLTTWKVIIPIHPLSVVRVVQTSKLRKTITALQRGMTGIKPYINPIDHRYIVGQNLF